MGKKPTKILSIPALKIPLVIDERYHRLINNISIKNTPWCFHIMCRILIFDSKVILDQSENGNGKKKSTFFGDSKHHNMKNKLKIENLRIICNIHI